MSRKNYELARLWRALPLVLFLLATCQSSTSRQSTVSEPAKSAQQNRSPEQKSIKSVVVHVVGESFVGIQYSKRITVTNTGSNYVLDYYCFKCKCPKLDGKKLDSSIAEQFFQLIESLEDGGQMASCCDHPYTEVEIAHSDESVKKIVLSFDLTLSGTYKEKEFPGVEKVLKIECDAKSGPSSG